MDKWYGAAGVCINEKLEILMIKQGKSHEPKMWAVPGGGKEESESYENCCIREIFEETGYEVKINQSLHVKEGVTFGVPVEVHYFLVNVIGGSATIQDPDELIHEIAWKSVYELETLEMGFPEDRNMLINLLNGVMPSDVTR